MEILRQSSATREDLGLLAVMDALEERDEISQRELARVTGLNLKKVNYCLHKLLEKGHVKFQRVRDNPDKRSYLYILTPAGLKAKSRLTYSFLRFTFDFYNRVEEKLQTALEHMVSKKIRSVILCGKSDVARIMIDLAGSQGKEVEIVGVIDSEWEDSFAGVPIVDWAQVPGLEYDAVVVTDFEDADGTESALKEAGVPEEQIWVLS